MATQFPSDPAIINLNNALNDALLSYLPDGFPIIFDLPDLNNLPSDPTLSVFLYEIHEDLQLRSAQARINTYNPDTKVVTILPGWVNVNCNYLITYWESPQITGGVASPASASNNQAIQIMNQVVNALINNRTLADIPGAYTRMIPPNDELSGLGNFWQSLGNRPRLSLYAAVTVPVGLIDKSNRVPGVITPVVDMEQIQDCAFELKSNPGIGSVVAGGSLSFTIICWWNDGLSRLIQLGLSGLPVSASATFIPDSLSAPGANSSLTITTTSGTPAGSYRLEVTGKSGDLTNSVFISLEVNPG
jgi:hypothetical protein